MLQAIVQQNTSQILKRLDVSVPYVSIAVVSGCSAIRQENGSEQLTGCLAVIIDDADSSILLSDNNDES